MLPTSIGNLSDQLFELYLYANQLHGYIPRSIGNLVGLNRLHLARNQFTGYIPSTIGNLYRLKDVHLDTNQLSGKIPDVVGNLSSLLSLNLSSNKLEGVIPLSLGNCRSLIELYLYDNKLTGKIPTKLLQIPSLSKTLDLSRNNLFGSIPSEAGDLKMLSELYLSDNNLSGNIPSNLGGCVSLSILSIQGNLFQGIIPPSLSSLKALVEIDMSRNNLSGQIPKFLERLQYLNLSYNDFEGEVPTSGVFANVTTFSVLGNSRLCGGFVGLRLPKCKETKKHKTKFLMFVVVGVLSASILLTIICLLYAWQKKKSNNQLSQTSINTRFLKVSYDQLLKGTDGFSKDNLIGRGGFGSVYKGIIEKDGERVVIAVKVLHLQYRGAQRSFMRECEAWQNIRHRNLLKIITSCSSIDYQGNDFKALVYEFMPNGSLHDWLHPTLRLNLLQITNILMDVASALDYLHNYCIPSIVHGDVKPNNILLADDMVARVGDFGLARFIGTSYENSSTEIRGTIGYTAPEYGLGNEMTTSGDVYSFGILLLEAITGKMPTDNIFNEGFSLHKFASMALLDHVIDVNILKQYQDDESFIRKKEKNAQKIEECLASIVKIGVSCTMDDPPQRMDIKTVMQKLQQVLDTLQNI
uniref:probable LRR receptor-like serine/threonine-protein kinase At3g47570 n=1 Tax=Erigeron canadensis TaxID=72917 RepID=UPI001CB9A6F6|nr:probable LRR receptor-like serine/threonine-protein kinase At3g47570 [Erigeron canadensis]